MSIAKRASTTFDGIKALTIIQDGDTNFILVVPREGPGILAAKGVSIDQGLMLREQLERRTVMRATEKVISYVGTGWYESSGL